MDCKKVILLIVATALISVHQARADTHTRATITPWNVETHSVKDRPTMHDSCTASRNITTTLSVTLNIDKKKRVLVWIEGVNFEIADNDTRALIAVDDGEPIAVYALRITGWRTLIEMPADTTALLKQIAKGKRMHVVAGTRKYSVDLVGSLDALRKLETCNRSGQIDLDRKRMAEAQPALLRAG